MFGSLRFCVESCLTALAFKQPEKMPKARILKLMPPRSCGEDLVTIFEGIQVIDLPVTEY